MLSLRVAGFCLLTLCAQGQQVAPAPEVEPDSDWRVFWKNGLRAESADGDYWFKIGGRLHQDWGTFGSTGLRNKDGELLEDGIRFRRARIEFDGQVHGPVRYRAHYEFAGEDVSFRDLWAEWTELPLRVGFFREPLGLEANTSSNALTFLERSAPSIALTPGRNSGVMHRRSFADGSVGLALGAFRVGNSAGTNNGDDVSITGRLTWLPVDEDDGRELVHLGIGASQRVTRDEGYGVRARLESFTAGPVIDTVLEADEVQNLCAEAAWVAGPFSAQAELLGVDADGAGTGNARLWGAYAQVSWTATGEHRPYSHTRYAFRTIVPKHDVSRKTGGKGAWELAARWSRSDFRDAQSDGATVDALTAAVNWYLNRSTRVMFNWIHSEQGGIPGDEEQFYLRFQVTF